MCTPTSLLKCLPLAGYLKRTVNSVDEDKGDNGSRIQQLRAHHLSCEPSASRAGVDIVSVVWKGKVILANNSVTTDVTLLSAILTDVAFGNCNNLMTAAAPRKARCTEDLGGLLASRIIGEFVSSAGYINICACVYIFNHVIMHGEH